MPVALPNLPQPTYHKLFRALEKFLQDAVAKELKRQKVANELARLLERQESSPYNIPRSPELAQLLEELQKPPQPFDQTLKALYYADRLSREGTKRNGKKTTGLRKDGRTPEFQHQLEIALLITTLPGLLLLAETLTVALLHDVLEDYVGQEEYIRVTFGESVYRRAQILNKYHPDGTEKDEVQYFAECAADEVTSIVKGGDNSHNQSTMHGVFPLPKVFHHIKRCAVHILPMLKSARGVFKEQYDAYENLKYILRNQCLLAVEILNAAGFQPEEDTMQSVEAALKEADAA
jgi:(p)ppGpp synthase/HD superfamily hydrolase